MPDIFRGIHLDPLKASNSFYLLWMILGYMIVGSVLIVSLGRLGDMFGRVRIYNLGFVIYTAASLVLAVDWLKGSAGANYLIVFRIVQGVRDPMFRLPLFRIRAFTFGTLSTFLSAVARGGLMFMLIIWLQGIWLPQHGYNFTDTPLWAGIYMLPLTMGMLITGPLSGYLSDRFGARPFASGGMVGAAVSFAMLMSL